MSFYEKVEKNIKWKERKEERNKMKRISKGWTSENLCSELNCQKEPMSLGIGRFQENSYQRIIEKWAVTWAAMG